jgi:uncharacterized protein
MRRSLLLLLLILCGCSSPPRERFYTLDAPEPPAPAEGAPSIAVAASIPELVDRPQLVLRAGAHQVAITEQARWAEPLRSAVARVVAANLAVALGGRVVGQRNGDADYRVSLDVQRFESAPGEAALVDAAWTVAARSGERHSGRSVAREKPRGSDYDALAAAHSAALAAISREIAAALRKP